MECPLISIVIPVYNAEEFLKRCFRSVIDQSYRNVEVVLVDDGSVDGSSRMCDDFAEIDKRVVVVHQKNKGVSVARNKGVELAHGEYIAFVDADDWIDSCVCEVFFNALKKYSYDLFCFSASYEGKSKSKKSFFFADDIVLLSSKQKDELHCKMMTPCAPSYEYNCNTRFAGSACGRFYRTEILKQNNFLFSTKTIISEDVLFNVLTFDAFEKIGYTTKVFYHYRLQECSAQNRYRPNSILYFNYVIDEIRKWLENNKKEKKFYDSANTLFVHYLFGILKEDLFHPHNPDWKNSSRKLEKILGQEKIRNILKNCPSQYFSIPERMLVCALRGKYFSFIRIAMWLYQLIR